MMKAKTRARDGGRSLLDVVALLSDVSAQRLARGQSAQSSRSLMARVRSSSSATIMAVPTRSRLARGPELLVLHYVPEAA
jgi:hypothetical protein